MVMSLLTAVALQQGWALEEAEGLILQHCVCTYHLIIVDMKEMQNRGPCPDDSAMNTPKAVQPAGCWSHLVAATCRNVFLC